MSTGVDAASLSSSFDGTPGWWFNADMKCSRQRSSVSSSERHGNPSDLWMVAPVTFLFPDSSRIALKTGLRRFSCQLVTEIIQEDLAVMLGSGFEHSL